MGFLRRVSATLLLLQNSLALCFPSHLLLEEIGSRLKCRAGPSSGQAGPGSPHQVPLALPMAGRATSSQPQPPRRAAGAEPGTFSCPLLQPPPQVAAFIPSPPGCLQHPSACAPAGGCRGGLCGGCLSVSAGDQAARLRTMLCCISFCLNCSTPFLLSSLST